MSFKVAHSGQLHFQILRLLMLIAHWEAPTADFVWSMCFDDSGRISFVGYMWLTLWACGLWHSSISNLGMFQVDHFCAIINPPQVLSLLHLIILPIILSINFHSVIPNKLYFSILSYVQSSYEQHPWHLSFLYVSLWLWWTFENLFPLHAGMYTCSGQGCQEGGLGWWVW